MQTTPINALDGDLAVGRNISAGGDAAIRGDMTVGHSLRVDGWFDAPNIKGASKGLFLTPEALLETYPLPRPGWWALVGATLPARLWVTADGNWKATDQYCGEPEMDMSAIEENINQKILKAVESLTDEEGDNAVAKLTAILPFSGIAQSRDIRAHAGQIIFIQDEDCFAEWTGDSWTEPEGYNSDGAADISKVFRVGSTLFAAMPGKPYKLVKYTLLTDVQSLFWTGTQSEYDSIVVKDPNVFYFIKEP